MINVVNIPRAYSEVYYFINALGEDYINKIPKNIYITIRDNRDFNYNVTFNKNQKIENSTLSREALALISALNLQYWCTNEDEKKELKKVYVNNSKIEQEKYSYNNLFKDRNISNNVIENKDTKQNVQIIEYKRSVFNRIINKIKEFFYKFKKSD